ncbi:hypothetical protein OROHE_009932 [Orobanche hederae]
MNMRSREQMESRPYLVREGEPDCSYYVRTGICRFGPTCRFNHPPNRKLLYALGLVEEEASILKNIPTDGESSLWAGMFASCRFEGDVRLGVQIAKELIENLDISSFRKEATQESSC